MMDREPAEINVVVTGGAPWGEGTPWPPIPINPSWLIANALPRVIFRDGKPNIRIITYPDALKTSWHEARELIPKMWDGEKDLYRMYIQDGKPRTFAVGAMIHMGMLDQPGEAFRLERNSFKGEYEFPDVDGRSPDQDDKSGGGTWDNIPGTLSTDIDIDSVHKRIVSELTESGLKIVISEDPNRYLCAYEYFTSLAALYNRHEKKRVMFIHTPIEHKSSDVENGVMVIGKVIEALVDDLSVD